MNDEWKTRQQLLEELARERSRVVQLEMQLASNQQAEPAEKRTDQELERRVSERVAELSEANELLQAKLEQQRQTDEELDIFRRFAEASGQGFGMADLNGHITYVNPTLFRWSSEKTPQDCIGRPLTAYMPADYRERREKEILPAVRRNGCWQGEEIVSLRDGRQISTIFTVFPVLDEGGELLRTAVVITDITELRRAEEALRESERRMQMALEVSLSFAFQWEVASDRVLRSDSCCRILGLSGDEAIHDTGQGFFQRIHPDDRDRFVRTLGELKPSGDTYRTEYRVTRGDGATIVLEESARGFFDSNGMLQRVIGVAKDITEGKRAEDALRLLTQFQEENPNPVLRIAEDGMLLFANSPACDWLATLDGQEDESLPDAVRAVVADAVQGQGAVETELTSPAGETLWLSAVQPAGERHVNVYARDVTGRKRAEEALRDSEAKYRALVESSPDAVFMCDLDGTIVFASQQAAQLLGFDDVQELVGRPTTEFVVPEERELMRANIRRLLKEGVSRNDEYRGLRRDGSMFFGNVSASVISNLSGEPQSFMGICRDITERKVAEEAMRQTDAELLAVAEIQAFLLPHEVPRFQGFDIAGQCYSASAAAGDHFDYLECPDGSLLIVLADVCGHGLGPALVAADFCARLRTLSGIPCELTELAERINAGLYQETDVSVFVTAVLGRLDAQSRTFTCINAGHPPVIVLDSTGRERARLESGGLPYAILDTTPFTANEPVALDDGDLLFLYTDGLTEAHCDEEPQFGLDRAIQVVRDNQHRPAAEIVEALHDAVCNYIAPQKPKDDVTVVVAKVDAGPTCGSSAGETLAVTDAKLSVPKHFDKTTDVIDYPSNRHPVVCVHRRKGNTEEKPMATVEKLGGMWVIVRSEANEDDNSPDAADSDMFMRRLFWAGDGWAPQFGLAKQFLSKDDAEAHLEEHRQEMN